MKASQRRFYHDLETIPDLFRDFGAVPQEFLSTDVAMLWMETASKKLGVAPSLLLKQIPSELITDKLLIKAVDLRVSVLGDIDPTQADNYLGIVLRAANKSSEAFAYIHESYRTEAVLDALIENQVMFDFEQPFMAWVKPMLNQQHIDQISSNDFWFAVSVGFENVSWDIVKELLKTHPDEYVHVNTIGSLNYLTRMLVEGEWPESKKQLQYQPLKSLADGVTRFMRVEKMTPMHYLLKAYIFSFPVEQVIAAMKTPARREVLYTLYTAEVLRQHSGSDRNLRGHFLEEDMGL